MGKMIDYPGAVTPVEGAVPRFVALPSDVDEARHRLAALMKEPENWGKDSMGMGVTPVGSPGGGRSFSFGESNMERYAEGKGMPYYPGRTGPPIEVYPTEACLMGGVVVVVDGETWMRNTLVQTLSEAVAFWFLETDEGLQHLSECDTDHEEAHDAEALITIFNDCTLTKHEDIIQVLNIMLAGQGIDRRTFQHRISAPFNKRWNDEPDDDESDLDP